MSKLQVFRCSEIIRNDLPIFKDNVERYILGKVSGDFVVLGNITNGEINLDGLHIRRNHWNDKINLLNNAQTSVSLKFKSDKVDKYNKFIVSIPELSMIYIYSPKMNDGSVVQINTKTNTITILDFDLFEKITKNNKVKRNIEIVSSREVKNKKIMSE